MNTLFWFVAEIIISLGMSTAVIFVIARPLMHALQDLCPTARQAEFWASYARTMLTLSPLLLVLIVDGANSNGNALHNIRIALIASLAGLIIGLIILGKKVFIPVAQQIEKNAQTGASL